MAAKEAAFDFTNVKDGGGAFNKRHQTPGDYKAKVTKVQDAPSKSDGVSQWLFTIECNGGTYPYYCKHQENQLWKIRNLLIAAGLNVPKKRVKVDPNKIVGRTIAITLGEEEYNGKMQGIVESTFPVSELGQDSQTDDEDDADEDEDDEPTPPAKKKAAPVEDDDDEDEDDTPPPPKKKKAAPPPEEDEDEDEEEEAPPPKKKKRPAPSDEDLEELDIDDV